MLFFDTESNWQPELQYECGQYQTLRLGCAIAGRLEAGKWTREHRSNFTTQEEFWAFVAERADNKRPVWCFAHNIGYDLTLLGFPERLRSGEFKIFDETKDQTKTDRLNQKFLKTKGFICTDNPPVIISCTHKTGYKVIFIDTFNYWTTSLAKIGEMVGNTKGVMPDMSAPLADWFAYCVQDVEVLKTAVLGLVEWIKTNNLGKFRFTAPSQAMAAFRHRWNKPAITCHANVSLRKFERQAYYGGRLECFFIGELKEKCYELDVTSLYPSVMCENLYPAKLESFYHPTCHVRFKPIELDVACIAEVKLHTQTGFPKRDVRFGTYYPVGDYWTTLAGPELMRAKQNNSIKEIRAWSRYELAPVFNGFVNWFWNYRKDQQTWGNEINANLAKLLMNGLYGKFGQLTNAWTERLDIPPSGKFGMYIDDEHADGKGTVFRQIGTTVLQFTGKQEHPFAFPAIAAYVTAYAREWMLTLRKAAGFDHCFYLVTDALFVDEIGYQRLKMGGFIRDNELGFLRVKHESDSAAFQTLHHYQIGDHKVEGSKKKSARKNDDGSFTEIHFESLDKILMRPPDGSVHTTPVRKTFSKDYKRGTIQADGWVKPLFLQE